MSPAEIVRHSIVPPSVGRIIHVFSNSVYAKPYAHLPMAAIVVEIVERPMGREHPIIYVQPFVPPNHNHFRSLTRDEPYLTLSAVPDECNEDELYWKWPPRVP